MKRLSLVLIMVLSAFFIYAQRTITGNITDESGEALIGASVVVQGTTTGAITDIDGNYRLEVPEGSEVLVISYTGYATEEVALGASNILDITMQAGVTLDAAIVTALGIEKEKKALGYSVESTEGENLVTAQESNIVNSLAGKFSGVQVTSSGGQAGASSRVIIRGASSFLGNNQPLFVIDGIPVDNSQTFGGGQNNANGTGTGDSPLFFGGTTNRGIDLDPNTIASVSVLKGASATALYGSRAANGVILIKTKSGAAAAKPKITYSFNYGQAEARLPELQDKYAQGLNGQYRSGLPGGTLGSTSWGPLLDTLRLGADGELDPNGTLAPRYKNAEEFFQTAPSMEHQFSVSGGSDRFNYFLSYGRLDQEGIVLNNELKRNNFLAKFNANLSEKLSVTTSINFINTNLFSITEGNGRQSYLWTVYPAPNSYNLRGENNQDYLNPDGTQRLYRTPTFNNPYFVVDNNGLASAVNRFLPTLSVEYKLTDWLTVINRLGGDFYSDSRDYLEVNGTRGSFPNGRVYKDEINYAQWNNDFILQASKRFGDFDMDFLLGSQVNDRYNNRVFTQGQGLSVPNFTNISNASTLTAVESLSEQRLVGVYAQANIGYRSFAYLTLTGRNDWTSTLPQNNNSYFYPSISGSVVLTDAIPALQSNDVLSFLKLRLGAAQVGNDAPPYSTASALYVQSSVGDGQRGNINFPFNGQNGFTVSNVEGNPNLKPERTTEYEAGLEFMLFQNRVRFEGSYYNRLTKDQIFQAPVAASAGAVSRFVNAGSMRNEGYELLLDATPLRIGGFEWTVGVNFTKNTNTVEELTEGVENIRLAGFTSPGIYIVRDEGYGVIWGTTYARNDEGQVIIDDDPTSTKYGLPATVNANLDVIGNTQPDWLGGARTAFSYSNEALGRISLSGVLDIREGGDILNLDNFYMNFYGVTKASENREGRYTDPNDQAAGVTGPSFVYPNGVLSDGSPNNIEVPYNETYWRTNWGEAQEEWVEDGSFVRLREVTLAYNLPVSVLDRTPFESLGIRITGRNLWLDTPNFSGSDPETSLYGSANGQGFYNFITPGTKAWNIALNVTF